MREYVSMECKKCGSRNYRTPKQTKGEQKKKLELKKYCKICRAHVLHTEKRK